METLDLQQRVRKLAFNGVLERWDEVAGADWLPRLVEWEEESRACRSLQRRIRSAKLERFKPMADFDWKWPKKIARDQVEDLMGLRFIEEHANAIIIGPNGVGKSMIAYNIAHRALIAGHSVLATNASQLLTSLDACETASALDRRLRALMRPGLLVIDELGYLSYSDRYADLLFQVVSRRYGERSILLTTNKEFKNWNEAFPNATTVVTLVDRLVHNAEIVNIEGESYRLKEAQERSAARNKERGARRAKPKD